MIVTEGKVLVAEKSEELRNPLKLENVYLPQSSLALVQGEMVELGSASEQKTQIDSEQIEASLSWQQGNLVFKGEPLEHAMAEVSRYTPYSFEFADEQLKQIQVAGLFQTGDVDGLLSALEQNFNVKHQRIGSSVIRLRKSDTLFN